VCREKPLLSYDLRADCDTTASRVHNFLAPHRSVSLGGHWGDDCPGALPYAFQWTLFLAHLSELSEETCTYIEEAFYAPSVEDGVDGVGRSKTFAEASVFAEFLLDLMSSSFTALMDLPELSSFSDWPASRLRWIREQEQRKPACKRACFSSGPMMQESPTHAPTVYAIALTSGGSHTGCHVAAGCFCCTRATATSFKGKWPCSSSCPRSITHAKCKATTRKLLSLWAQTRCALVLCILVISGD
jgi:hypothetical protein